MRSKVSQNMKSCICGGMNENCRYCRGSGQGGRRVHLRRRAAGSRRGVRASVQSSGAQVAKNPVSNFRCPMCGATVRNLRNLQKHLKKVAHTAVFCPLPQQKPTRNTPQHGGELRGAASNLQRARAETVPQVRSKVSLHSSGMTSCPVCSSTLKSKNLASHMSRVHRADSPIGQGTRAQAHVKVSKKYRKRQRGLANLFKLGRSANIPSSLGRIPDFEFRWPVGGGLPDSNRSRH